MQLIMNGEVDCFFCDDSSSVTVGEIVGHGIRCICIPCASKVASAIKKGYDSDPQFRGMLETAVGETVRQHLATAIANKLGDSLLDMLKGK